MHFLYLLLFYVPRMAEAHSWAERGIVVSSDRAFKGDPGFPRGFVFRNATDSPDAAMTYLLPPNSRDQNTILSSDLICRESQISPNQTQESPLLSAFPLSTIMLMYQENGHVTLLDSTPGKATSGTVSIYGTSESLPSDTLQAIHQVWTNQGDGGDRRGRLLSRASFDDGNCYQVSGSPESIRRQKIPHRQHAEFEGNDLWCGTTAVIPPNVPRGSTYTLYWVWDWPTEPDISALPNGKVEIYTTCLDVKIM